MRLIYERDCERVNTCHWWVLVKTSSITEKLVLLCILASAFLGDSSLVRARTSCVYVCFRISGGYE